MEDINIKKETFGVTKEVDSQEISKDKIQTKKKHHWEKISYYLFLALAFLLPFWVIPFGGFSVAASKAVLVYVLVLVSAIFYLIHVLSEGKISYLKSIALYALGGIVLISFFSALFSGSFLHSLFGAGSEVGTFSFIFILSIALFLTTVFFREEKRALSFSFLFIVSSFIVFICQLIRFVFDVDFGGILASKTNTLLGSWADLSVFFGFIGLVSIIVLEFFGEKLNYLKSGFKWRLFLYLILFFSLLVMVITNFVTTWIVFGFLLLVFFVYLFSAFGKKRNFISLPFLIILLSVFFILARPLTGELVASMGFDVVEIRPSWGVTLDITKQTLNDGAKNLFLGSGPNTFTYQWLKFKPVDINQTMFWAVGFQSGVGFLPTLFITTGLLGIFAWLFFLGIIFYYGIKAVGYSENDIVKSLLFGSFLGSAYLWIFTFIYNPGIFVLILTFLVTGLFLAMLAKSGYLQTREFSFIDKTSFGFVFSLVAVLMLIISISGFYMLFQKYWAIYSYNKGLMAFNIGGDLEKAEGYFVKAARFDKQDRYYRSLAELGMVKIAVILKQQLPKEEAKTQFQNVLADTVQNAQTAVDLNPTGLSNWFVLGQVYENIIPLKVQGSREAALEAYSRASKIAPTDPRPFLLSARVEAQSGKNEEARAYLISALELKRNYTAALFLLSKITAQEGDLKNAIAQTEAARLTAPNDIGVLFQLGMFYYQDKDYGNAQPVFEKIISLNPNYSNARYFLGLVYEKNGNDPAAIKQFEAIQELNPDNTEVKKILSNLRAGKYALSNIDPEPEDREEPPIEE